MQYAICEISGRQYLIKPGQIIEIDKLQDSLKTLEVDKVLLIAGSNKVEVGRPYLKMILKFEVMDNIKKHKIRVVTYKPKANYRRVIGQRREVSRIQLTDGQPKTDLKSVKSKA